MLVERSGTCCTNWNNYICILLIKVKTQGAGVAEFRYIHIGGASIELSPTHNIHVHYIYGTIPLFVGIAVHATAAKIKYGYNVASVDITLPPIGDCHNREFPREILA